jgi:hypothetical protein
VTRAARRARLSEAYRIVAAELDHHFGNGSEFLHLEPDGTDSPAEVVELRFKVLAQARDEMERRAARLAR